MFGYVCELTLQSVLEILRLSGEVSQFAFNLVSVVAIIGSAWWFINRGALRASLSFNVRCTRIEALASVGKRELVLEVTNIGARDVWLCQTVLSLQYCQVAQVPDGPIETSASGEVILFNGQVDRFAIVPNAPVSLRFVIAAPDPSEIVIARFFVFPGKKIFTVVDQKDLDAAIGKAGSNYYFDELILDIC